MIDSPGKSSLRVTEGDILIKKGRTGGSQPWGSLGKRFPGRKHPSNRSLPLPLSHEERITGPH